MVVVKVMAWKLSVSGIRNLRRSVMAAPTVFGGAALSVTRLGQKPPVGDAPVQDPVVAGSVAGAPESRFRVPPPGRSWRRLVPPASRRKQLLQLGAHPTGLAVAGSVAVVAWRQ